MVTFLSLPVTAQSAESAGNQPLSPALYLELTCSMLRSGLPLTTCLLNLAELNQRRHADLLTGVVARLGAGGSWEESWRFMPTPDELLPLRHALGLMLESGAPTADLLEVLADRQRRHSYRQAEKSAAKLGVKLVVPLGLCSLPAFICLGIVPVVVSMIPQVF